MVETWLWVETHRDTLLDHGQTNRIDNDREVTPIVVTRAPGFDPLPHVETDKTDKCAETNALHTKDRNTPREGSTRLGDRLADSSASKAKPANEQEATHGGSHRS